MDKKRKFKELRLEEKIKWLFEHVKDDKHVNQVISLNRDLKDYQEQMTHGEHLLAKKNERDLEVRVNNFIDANWEDIYPMMLEEESISKLKYLEAAIQEKNSVHEEISKNVKLLKEKEVSLLEDIKKLDKKIKTLNKIFIIRVSSIVILFFILGVSFFIGYSIHKVKQIGITYPINDSIILVSKHKHIIDSIIRNNRETIDSINNNYEKNKELNGNHTIHISEVSSPPGLDKPDITIFIEKSAGSGSDPDKEKLLKQEIELALQKKFNPYIQPYEKSPDLKITYSITKVTPQELKYDIYMKDIPHGVRFCAKD